jgi:hypothetical protein
VTANSSSAGCVGNVILDIQIDRREKVSYRHSCCRKFIFHLLNCLERQAESWAHFHFISCQSSFDKNCSGRNRPRVSFGFCLKLNLATTVHKAERTVRQRLEPHLAETHVAA